MCGIRAAEAIFARFDFATRTELRKLLLRPVSRDLLTSGSAFTFLSTTGTRKIKAWFSSILVMSSLCVVCTISAKSKQQDYGQGFSTQISSPEEEVLQAVRDVVADGIIQGTKEYNKDEYVTGAEEVSTTSAFSKWNGPGQVFFKIKRNALDPRNFKDTGDSGTLAVRYIVQKADDKNSILKIDAVFVDDSHLGLHLSNGSVESAEFKEIQDHLASAQLKQQEAADQARRHQHELAARELARTQKEDELDALVARAPNESLEQHVANLRRQAERVVKAPGTQLKSAPFKSA